jgi:hypothetical protein
MKGWSLVTGRQVQTKMNGLFALLSIVLIKASDDASDHCFDPKY